VPRALGRRAIVNIQVVNQLIVVVDLAYPLLRRQYVPVQTSIPVLSLLVGEFEPDTNGRRLPKHPERLDRPVAATWCIGAHRIPDSPARVYGCRAWQEIGLNGFVLANQARDRIIDRITPESEDVSDLSTWKAINFTRPRVQTFIRD